MNPGRGVTLLFPAIILLTINTATSNQLQGNVGCIFSADVCEEDEKCFDDLVLGRCISASSNLEHLRLGPLSGPPLGLLGAEMRRVFGLGLTWKDVYTQCVFQTLMHHFKYRLPYSSEECNDLLLGAQQQHNPDIPPYQDNQGQWQPQDLTLLTAISDQDGVYEPWEPQQWNNQLDPVDDDGGYVLVDGDGDDEDYDISNDNINQPAYNNINDQDPMEDVILLTPEERDAFIANYIQSIGSYDQASKDIGPIEDEGEGVYLADPSLEFGYPEEYIDPSDEELTAYIEPTMDQFQQLRNLEHQLQDSQLQDSDSFYEEQPFIRRQRNADNMGYLMMGPQPTQYSDGGDDMLNPYQTDSDSDNLSTYDFDYNDSSAVLDGDNDDAVYYSLEEPLDDRAFLPATFDRKERLDVKKPGPFFTNSANNFYLNKLRMNEDLVKSERKISDVGQTEYEMSLSPQGLKKKKDIQEDSVAEYREVEPLPDTYLVFNLENRLRNLGQARDLMTLIAEMTHVPLQSFGEPHLEVNRIRVRIDSNPRQLNATDMASRLTEEFEEVQEKAGQLGLHIQSITATDENGVVSTYTGDSNLFLYIYLLAAGVGALLFSVIILFVVKKWRTKEKKVEAKQEKEEPVNQYKQLVRDWSRSSRTSQTSNEAGNNTPRHPLIHNTVNKPNKTTLNQEESRTSSTSSWSEEPGVSTMDISTGHMVLNYMEDHLKNKQRLEQEWVGLCAYEAEPAATSIAFQVENKKKNRYPDKLPYDHNRVLLNALVNGSNSDYINASTVTDHDPRNPAYIVTQGPMAHTVADFWQMVWEQGSVVIVMLSRLAENGYQLAHRYWPEEGSEQYHIYEVHLVSEHVWCDDCLVRSLYLKNTQTNETRTVTQFHYLSWSDSSVPPSTKSLLEFRRKVNKSYRGRSCPVIVHCSDGVGRSGTYILIDMVLSRIAHGSKEIDIAATLEHIRDQRSGMVQTRSQFEFCLTAVAEETHAILKSLAQQ